MEPTFFYFKETLLEANNRFMLGFSNKELVYQICFSNENDYYLTTMNCSVVIVNDYSDLLDDVNELSTKSWWLLEKRPAYQFSLSLLRLAFYFPGMEKKVDDMYFLSYPENIDLYSWKYKFYNVKDNQVKDCKIFSLYAQFKTEGFEFQDVQKIKKYHVIIDDQNKNIFCNLNWKLHLII